MAIDNFRGTQIGYDPTVKQKIEDQLTRLTPDGLKGDINISDYALIFAGMIESIVLKNRGMKIIKIREVI